MKARRQPPAKPAADDRRRELAAIHAAATKLGMDTADRNPASTYRTMLQAQAGVTSAADLDQAGRRRVRTYLMRLANPTPDTAPGARQQALIQRLWQQLGQAGALDDPTPAGLAAFIRRMHGVDSARWLTAIQGGTIIEALKAWKDRHANGSR